VLETPAGQLASTWASTPNTQQRENQRATPQSLAAGTIQPAWRNTAGDGEPVLAGRRLTHPDHQAESFTLRRLTTSSATGLLASTRRLAGGGIPEAGRVSDGGHGSRQALQPTNPFLNAAAAGRSMPEFEHQSPHGRAQGRTAMRIPARRRPGASLHATEPGRSLMGCSRWSKTRRDSWWILARC